MMAEPPISPPPVPELQARVCARFGSPVCPPEPGLKIGLALQTRGQQPVTGMRAEPAHGTAGWYIWAGAYGDEPDFFQPVHVQHMAELWPQLLPYLALAPGFRFIIDDEGYEDVWIEPVQLAP